MSLFKKKKPTVPDCGCGKDCNVNAESIAQAKSAQNKEAMVKVLGSGCKKCNKLEANTKAALTQLGMDTTIDHVTDFGQIAAYGVMTTPALMVNGKVVSYGKVLKTDKVVKLLEKARA